jgi:hypothetical protein
MRYVLGMLLLLGAQGAWKGVTATPLLIQYAHLQIATIAVPRWYHRVLVGLLGLAFIAGAVYAFYKPI